MSAAITTSQPATAGGACLDGVDLHALAARLGTPLHVYSASIIRERIVQLRGALEGLNTQVCYAAKANSNGAILGLMADAGFGADIVSGGELERCLRAGIRAEAIVFSGVGKTAAEITQALDAGIARFNVESEDELYLMQRIAAARDVVARASVRINPDVDALTHAKISTGKAENKFGVTFDAARKWFANSALLSHVRLDGLQVHIGSQMLSVEPIRAALGRVAELWRELTGRGHAIRAIDVGGGLGVCYRPDTDRPVSIDAYANVIRQQLAGFDGCTLLEPGRWLVAEAGALLTRVIRIKQGTERRFVVLDAAMTELMRPALYGAWHEIAPVTNEERAPETCDVVGPVCETSDTFAQGRTLPRCIAGDLVMIKTTGAYGAAMGSEFNSRPLASEVLLERGRYAVIRRRQTIDDLLAAEQPAYNWETP